MTKMMLALAILVASAPVFAQTPALTPTTTAKADKKVCRQAVATGSIMPKRTCRTVSEWAQIDQANAASTENYSRRNNGSRR